MSGDKNAPRNVTYYSKIYDLSFYILGNDENLIDSNVNITNREVMKGDKPMIDGVYDAHMGTTDHAWVCHTCGNVKTICPGHFGSLELKYPVKNPVYRDELLKWLRVICANCGELVVGNINITSPKKMDEYLKLSKQVSECKYCGAKHHMISKDKQKPSVFFRMLDEFKKDSTRREDIYNHEIEAIVNKIKYSTLLKLDVPARSHPANMILRTIRAPPNTIRPDLRRIGGTRTNNVDATTLLKMMVEINDALPDEIPAKNQITDNIKNLYINLDMTYYSMVKGGGGGEIKQVMNTNKEPVAICERWPKKSGRVRKNLMGKRVEYMMRSVIVGNTRLKLDELGIPKMHAMNLAVPEVVQPYNRDRLMTYFLNGNKIYPGAKLITKKADGGTYRIENLNKDYQLQIGDIVYRSLCDGDLICFNRQPSLSFASIAGFRAKIIDGATIQLNPSSCKGFNADFDGDSCNVIVNQSIQARNEGLNVSHYNKFFLSPQTRAPVTGSFQDSLIGATELSKHGMKINKFHAMCMFSNVDDRTFIPKFNKKEYYGNELISMLLPEINIINKAPTMYKSDYASCLKYNPEDIKVNIIRGELIGGILDKSTIGQGTKNSIYHIIANEYSPAKALSVCYNLMQLTDRFLLYHGFSTGIRDISISSEHMIKIKNRITAMILKSREVTRKLITQKLIAPIGMSLRDFYEHEQLEALRPGDEFNVNILNAIDINTNWLARLIFSGAKGQITNFVNINAAVGSQTINGRRFPPQAGYCRTSPYFVRYDMEPESLGFISMSYREGISSEVFPFATGEARFGAISNALTTSVTGYQSRISIKNLESIVVDNQRRSVKGSNIIQSIYGECGLNAAKMVEVTFPTLLSSNEDFEKTFRIILHGKGKSGEKDGKNNKSEDKSNSKDSKGEDKSEKKDKGDLLAGLSSAQLKLLRDEEEYLDMEFKKLAADRTHMRHIEQTLEDHHPKAYITAAKKYMPVNVPQIIDNVSQRYSVIMKDMEARDKTLSPKYLYEQVELLCDEMPYIFLNDIQRKKKGYVASYLKSATLLFNILVRSYLCTPYLLRKDISDKLVDIIIENIKMDYKKALIDPGTSAGILAAHCISEPMTQFILNSKHRVGGQGGTQTNTIARIQEILGAKDTGSMGSPSMLVMVRSEFEKDKIKVREIANHIEMMDFKRFISSTRIFFEEYGKPVHPKFKHEGPIIKQIEKYNYGQKLPSDLAKWCIRFGIDKEELVIKSIKLENIILAIKKAMPKLYVIYTPENADEIFIRCYIRISMVKSTSRDFLQDVVMPTMEEIKNVVLRGIQGILSTEVVEVIKHVEDENGKLIEQKIYGISTMGTNLIDIIENPYVDPYRTLSDSMLEIEKIYGITSARNKIIGELSGTLDYDNYIHCGVFADEMCYTGSITSIQKTGLQKRENSNVTLRLSFQTPIQVIQNAAIKGLTDRIGGVSGPLIVGTTPNVGTTFNQVIVNEQFVKENVKSIEKVLEDL